jgi:hypothetical protein
MEVPIMKSRWFRKLPHLVLSLATALVVAGCSDVPTKPSLPFEPESSEEALGRRDTGAPQEVLGLNLLGDKSGVTTKTVRMGVLGGVVSVGDFTVVVPPMALRRAASVTVTQADLAQPVVELEIAPASANDFRLPVILLADVSRMDRSLLSIAHISYWNPATGEWERVEGSVVNIAGLTVSAPLMHFSKYRVSSGGKAGW